MGTPFRALVQIPDQNSIASVWPKTLEKAITEFKDKS
jgi:hypothetical protein